jgi:hypothetical protein
MSLGVYSCLMICASIIFLIMLKIDDLLDLKYSIVLIWEAFWKSDANFYALVCLRLITSNFKLEFLKGFRLFSCSPRCLIDDIDLSKLKTEFHKALYAPYIYLLDASQFYFIFLLGHMHSSNIIFPNILCDILSNWLAASMSIVKKWYKLY